MACSRPLAAPSRRGDGNGDASGVGIANGIGDGIGKGSPTRLPFLGTSGLRRERAVEGMACGARGRTAGRLFTSSRLGKTPSGAPLLGLAPSCVNLRGGRDRSPPAIANGASIAMNKEEEISIVIDFEIMRVAKSRGNMRSLP